MIRARIIIFLAFGGIMVQGGRMLNANTNSNVNMWTRRNSNANANTNIMMGGSMPSLPGKPRREDSDIVDSRLLLENVRRKLYDENDASTAAVATAAADATLLTAKPLVEELIAAIAVEVANAVAKTMRRHSARAAYARRNYNSNTNTNIIGQDSSNVREPQRGQGLNGLRQGYDLLQGGSGGSPLGWGSDYRRVPHDRETGRIFLDEEPEPASEPEPESEDEVVEEVEVTTEIVPVEVEVEVEVESEEEEEKKPVASKSLPNRGWGPINLPGYRGNSNSNANNNRMDFRRNSYPYNDPNADKPKKFMYNRNNLNSNSNSNSNNFRRATNPHPIDGHHRNINANANNNRINRGYGYRRD